MLIQALRRAKMLRQRGIKLGIHGALNYFLENNFNHQDFKENQSILLDRFNALDDTDIAIALKNWQEHFDPILSFLAKSLINRRLFKLEFQNEYPDPDRIHFIRQKIRKAFPEIPDAGDYLLVVGKETNTTYNTVNEEIQILMKNQTVKPMSLVSEHGILPRVFTKFYLCYPKRVMGSEE